MAVYLFSTARPDFRVLVWVCVMVLLYGCDSQAERPKILEQAVATSTATATATIEWFPPTPAPTFFALSPPAATPALKPDLGAPIFEDDFSGEVPQWQTLSTTAGSITYGHGELAVALRKSKSVLSSMLQAKLPSNYFLEITANPGLCRPGDLYGLVLGTDNAHEYYRFAINCSGEVRLERVKNGLVLYAQTSQISPEMLPSQRLSVMVSGKEMRFFTNDRFMFSVNGLTSYYGLPGVFARTGGDTPVTVGYSDLVIHSIADLPPTLTPLPSATMTPTRTPKIPLKPRQK